MPSPDPAYVLGSNDDSPYLFMKPDSTNLGTSEYAMGTADDSPYLFMKPDSTNLGTSEYAMGTADDSPYLFMKPDSTNLGTSEYAMGTADDSSYNTVTNSDAGFGNVGLFNNSVVVSVDVIPETEPVYATVRKTHGKGTYMDVTTAPNNGKGTYMDATLNPKNLVYNKNTPDMDITIGIEDGSGDKERRKTPYQDFALNVPNGYESKFDKHPERNYYSFPNDDFDLDEVLVEGSDAEDLVEGSSYGTQATSGGGKLAFVTSQRTLDFMNVGGSTAVSYLGAFPADSDTEEL